MYNTKFHSLSNHICKSCRTILKNKQIKEATVTYFTQFHAAHILTSGFKIAIPIKCTLHAAMAGPPALRFISNRTYYECTTHARGMFERTHHTKLISLSRKFT